MNIYFFLFFTYCLFINFPVQAQKKEAKIIADFPVLFFTTDKLKSDNPDSIRQWMEDFSRAEIKHLDSIEVNYTIVNPDLALTVSLLKAKCNLILKNWQQLDVPDSVVWKSSWPDYHKKAGAVEFNVFAKTWLQSPLNFTEAYGNIFKEDIKSLNNAEKKELTSYVLFFLFKYYSIKLFQDELNRIRQSSFDADTSLALIARCYANFQFETKTKSFFNEYLNELVKEKFTRADTLRGSLLPERLWWKVLHYDITVRPDYNSKTISGKNIIDYKVIQNNHPNSIQIDLQEPLLIDSVFLNHSKKLSFTKDGNAWHISVQAQKFGSINELLIYYHGKVHVAINPPWDGGWIWGKDSINNPFMSVTCQGIGASIWYPCKDHQSEEPENGASLSMIIPDSLVGISNGRLISRIGNHDGSVTYKWGVVNPINSYDICPYIGKYVHFGEVYDGLKGKLDLNFWVMNYNLEKAKDYMPIEVNKMLKAFENWFGPYPFYEDGYKLIESPSKGGMEHQSAVAYGIGSYRYGNIFDNDTSNGGWGLKWDYMLVHESGHEWFGNNITAKDIADMWIQEGFTCYSETLYIDYWFGKKAGNEYNVGQRKSIKNNYPVIGFYGVNDISISSRGDMYNKGSNMLQMIRHSIDNDPKWKQILIGLNKTFYHQTVTTSQIEDYISHESGFNYTKVFDQYLRTIQIPVFEYYFNPEKDTVFFCYTNCIKGFNLPLVLSNDLSKLKIYPEAHWKSKRVTKNESSLFVPLSIWEMYYLEVKEVKK